MPFHLELVTKEVLERRRVRYSELYAEAQALLDKHNPCQIDCSGGKFKCADGNGCCYGCEHLGPNGCTVEALGCKVWLCGTLRKTHPELTQQLDGIRDKTRYECGPLYLFRTSKEQAFSGVMVED